MLTIETLGKVCAEVIRNQVDHPKHPADRREDAARQIVSRRRWPTTHNPTSGH